MHYRVIFMFLLSVILLSSFISAACFDAYLQIEDINLKDNYIVIQRLPGGNDASIQSIDNIKIYINGNLEKTTEKGLQILQSRRIFLKKPLSDNQEIKLEANIDGETCEYSICEIGKCKSYQELQKEEMASRTEQLPPAEEESIPNEPGISTEEENESSVTGIEEPEQNESETNVEIINNNTNESAVGSNISLVLNWIASLLKI